MQGVRIIVEMKIIRLRTNARTCLRPPQLSNLRRSDVWKTHQGPGLSLKNRKVVFPPLTATTSLWKYVHQYSILLSNSSTDRRGGWRWYSVKNEVRIQESKTYILEVSDIGARGPNYVECMPMEVNRMLIVISSKVDFNAMNIKSVQHRLQGLKPQ